MHSPDISKMLPPENLTCELVPDTNKLTFVLFPLLERLLDLPEDESGQAAKESLLLLILMAVILACATLPMCNRIPSPELIEESRRIEESSFRDLTNIETPGFPTRQEIEQQRENFEKNLSYNLSRAFLKQVFSAINCAEFNEELEHFIHVYVPYVRQEIHDDEQSKKLLEKQFNTALGGISRSYADRLEHSNLADDSGQVSTEIKRSVRSLRTIIEREVSMFAYFPMIPSLGEITSEPQGNIVGERPDSEEFLPIQWNVGVDRTQVSYLPLYEHEINLENSQTHVAVARTETGDLAVISIFSYEYGNPSNPKTGYIVLERHNPGNDWVESGVTFIKQPGYLRNIIRDLLLRNGLTLVRIMEESEARSLSGKFGSVGLLNPRDYIDQMSENFDPETGFELEVLFSENIQNWIKERNPNRFEQPLGSEYRVEDDWLSKSYLEVLLPQALREKEIPGSIEIFELTIDGEQLKRDSVLEIERKSVKFTVDDGDRLPVFRSALQDLETFEHGGVLYRILAVDEIIIEGQLKDISRFRTFAIPDVYVFGPHGDEIYRDIPDILSQGFRDLNTYSGITANPGDINDLHILEETLAGAADEPTLDALVEDVLDQVSPDSIS